VSFFHLFEKRFLRGLLDDDHCFDLCRAVGNGGFAGGIYWADMVRYYSCHVHFPIFFFVVFAKSTSLSS
jgi:hypothetical protein